MRAKLKTWSHYKHHSYGHENWRSERWYRDNHGETLCEDFSVKNGSHNSIISIYGSQCDDCQWKTCPHLYHVTLDLAHDVTVHPLTFYGGAQRQRQADDRHEQIRNGQAQNVPVCDFPKTWVSWNSDDNKYITYNRCTIYDNKQERFHNNWQSTTVRHGDIFWCSNGHYANLEEWTAVLQNGGRLQIDIIYNIFSLLCCFFLTLLAFSSANVSALSSSLAHPLLLRMNILLRLGSLWFPDGQVHVSLSSCWTKNCYKDSCMKTKDRKSNTSSKITGTKTLMNVIYAILQHIRTPLLFKSVISVSTAHQRIYYSIKPNHLDYKVCSYVKTKATLFCLLDLNWLITLARKKVNLSFIK